MAQDVSSATETLEERAKHTVLLKQPSIVHTYAEGGGVLGKMFAVIARDWEQKTGIPYGLTSPVKEGTSTGCPFITGISFADPADPKKSLYSCDDVMRMYDDDCKIMFAEKPSRILKMLAWNSINLAKRFLDPFGNPKDKVRIETIKRYCNELLESVPADKAAQVAVLRERATKRWLSMADTQAALKLTNKLCTDDPGNPKKKIAAYTASETTKDLTTKIGLLINRRSTAQTGRLKTEFQRAAVMAMDTVQSRLGPRENRFHSPELKQSLFQMRMGDRKMNDFMGSIYFAAFSPRDMSFYPIYSRRENLMDFDPSSPAHVSDPNMKAWDANMATTANLLAYPPHKTEAGTLTVDKATIHTPIFGISEILRYKPKDLGVISITFSTGHIVSDDMTDEQLHAYYTDNGEAGNDRFLEECKAYTTTLSRMALANLIGEENIFVISPRMSWKDIDEMNEFPSSDITDASPENMAKIQRRAEKYLRDKQEKINNIWQVLTDNMYMLGQIDKPKFEEITERLGVKKALAEAAAKSNVVPLPTPPAKEAAHILQPPPRDPLSPKFA